MHGNHIRRSNGTAIQLGAELRWRESGPVENILIENNIILNCGYGCGRQKGATISVEVNGIKAPTDKLSKKIIIRNNVIDALDGVVIHVSLTNGT